MKILAANWKMNLGRSEASELARSISATADAMKKTEMWIAPSFPLLVPVADELQASRAFGASLRLGAQNVYWENEGAFTGEVSVRQLRDVGCHFVIVGHSERRQLFGELPENAAKRAWAALSQNLDVIFCVGETLQQRHEGNTLAILAQQLEPLVEALKPSAPSAQTLPSPASLNPKLVIAYEPVWAIGSGRAASLSDIAESHGFLSDWWQKHSPLPVPQILYGGSVAPENFFSILNVPRVSGALVGKASLNSKSFHELAKACEAAG